MYFLECNLLKRNQSDINEVAMMNDSSSSPVMLKTCHGMGEELSSKENGENVAEDGSAPEHLGVCHLTALVLRVPFVIFTVKNNVNKSDKLRL